MGATIYLLLVGMQMNTATIDEISVEVSQRVKKNMTPLSTSENIPKGIHILPKRYLHIYIHLYFKMKMSGKWMELENIILSEITQSQKDICNMWILASKFWSFIFGYGGLIERVHEMGERKNPSWRMEIVEHMVLKYKWEFRECLSLVFIVVVKIIPKSNLGRRGLFGLHFHLTVRAETPAGI